MNHVRESAFVVRARALTRSSNIRITRFYEPTRKLNVTGFAGRLSLAIAPLNFVVKSAREESLETRFERTVLVSQLRDKST